MRLSSKCHSQNDHFSIRALDPKPRTRVVFSTILVPIWQSPVRVSDHSVPEPQQGQTCTQKQKPSSSWLRTVRTCRRSKYTNLQRWETNMGWEDDETVEETPSPPPHPSGAPLTHQISTVDSFPTRTKIKISKLEYLYIYTFIYRETEVVGVSAMQGNLDRRRRNRVYQRLF